jgi:hypothetical protein
VIARTGQPGQDSQRRQSGQYIHDRKQRTILPEQDSKDRTATTEQGNRTTMTGHLAKDIWDRTTLTGQLGQVRLDRLVSHISLRGQPGWVSLDRQRR